jgi:hypothetical protein
MKLLAALALAATLGAPTQAMNLSYHEPAPVVMMQKAQPNSTTGGRNRAVRAPDAPSFILVNEGASDNIRYTNLDTKPQTIRTCVERTTNCLTDLLAPGASTTRTHPVADLGHVNTTLEFYTTGPAEIRSQFDAIPTTLATTQRQTIPVMDVNQQFTTTLTLDGKVSYRHLQANGVEIDRVDKDQPAGTTAIVPFTNLQLGEQVDVVPTTPTIMTATANGIRYRAKTASEATGVQYLVKADNSTTGWV